MLDPRLVLIKCITLLYLESRAEIKAFSSIEQVRGIIGTLKAPEASLLSIDHEKNVVEALRDLAYEMCRQGPSYTYDHADLTQRMLMICGDDASSYEAYYNATINNDPAYQTSLAMSIRFSLRSYQDEIKIETVLAKANYKYKYERNSIDSQQNFIRQLISELEQYQLDKDTQDPAIIACLDGDAPDRTVEYDKVLDRNNGKSMLVFGLQALNRLLGGEGGCRGETILYSALPNNFKTTMLLLNFWWLAKFNKPVLNDPFKKPLLVRISTEDDLPKNLEALYSIIFCDNEGYAPDMTKVTSAEMDKYVHENITANGWHYKMYRIDPSKWTPRDLANFVLKMEAEGYEIVSLTLDYFGMLQPMGKSENKSDLIKSGYQYTRNFMAIKNILFITAHQISNEAKKLLREGRTDFVKQLPGRGYYDACGRLDAEVDCEIHMHLETLNNDTYLTVARGKHRRTKPTPLKDRSFVVKLSDIGPIPYDYNKPDSSRLKVGGDVIGSGREIPTWETDDILV